MVLSPEKTFADVNGRPSWIFPFVLLLAANFAISYLVYRVLVTDVNFEQVAKAKINWDASTPTGSASPQTGEQQIDALRRQRERWYVLPPYAVAVSTLGLSVFFFAVLWAARARTTFYKVFSVVCWSLLVYRLLGGIVTAAALWIGGSQHFYPAPPEAWSPTSLAKLIPRTAMNHNAYSAISKLDIFLFWWLAVMVIGFAKTSENLSIQKSAVIVAASEVLYLLLNAMGLLPGAS